MKLTLEFDDDVLAPAIKQHLLTGKSVQEYLLEAVTFWNKCNEILNGTTLVIGVAPRRSNYLERVLLPATRGEE